MTSIRTRMEMSEDGERGHLVADLCEY